MKYIFSIKHGINTSEFFLTKKEKYNSLKHGNIQYELELDDCLTKKEINWNFRNMMDMYCFLH